MAAGVGIGVATVPTEPDTTTIETTSLAGIQHLAALLFYGPSESGTFFDQVKFSVGATDGTENRVHATNGIDGADPTECDRTFDENYCVVGLDTGKTPAIDTSAYFSEWDSGGGATVEFDNADGNGGTVGGIVFAADGGYASLETFELDTEDYELELSTAGFLPDVAFFFTSRQSSVDTVSAFGGSTIGWAVRTPGSTTVQFQGSLNYGSWDAYAYGRPYGQVSANYVLVNVSAGGSTMELEAVEFTSSGIVVASRDGEGSGRKCGCLLLNFGGELLVHGGTYTTPTSTGTDYLTGVPFTPSGMLLMQHLMPALETDYLAASAGTHGVGFSGGTSGHNFVITDAYAAAGNCAERYSGIILDCYTDTQGFGNHAALSGFTSDGAEFNFYSVGGGARVLPYVAFGRPNARTPAIVSGG